jgi:hypothetical protein
LLLGTSLAATGCGTTEPDNDRIVGTLPGWGVVVNPPSAVFTYGLDRSEKNGGQQSGFMSSRSAPAEGSMTFYQQIRADNYRGKRVRWSGWVQTRGIVGQISDGGGLWMTIYYPGEDGTGDKRARAETTGFRGTAGWRQVSVVLDVPPNAIGFYVAVWIQGPGELWVDDFALEEVGTSVTTTASVVSDSSPGALQSFATRGLLPENLGFEGL